MFDNRKIKHLRRLPDGNSIVLIWVMLLTLAGRCNSGGMIFLTENIPYTPKMLADELDFEESTVQLALTVLEQLGMIQTNGDGFLAVTGWSEHQNIEGMEKIKEQTRKRVADYRARKKQSLLLEGNTCAYCGKSADTIDHIIPRSKNGSDDESNIVPCCKSCNSSKKDKDLADFLNDSFYYYYQGIDHNLVRSNPKLMKYVRWDSVSNRYCNVTVTQSNAIEEDIEEEREEEKERDKIDYKGIVAAFNSICVSFPSVKALSDARKKAIKARLNNFSLDDFKTLFEKAEASSFLKGKNDRNWSATFDWLIKDSNMAKVLDGNYDDKPVAYRQTGKTTKAEELNDFYNMAAEWAKGE